MDSEIPLLIAAIYDALDRCLIRCHNIMPSHFCSLQFLGGMKDNTDQPVDYQWHPSLHVPMSMFTTLHWT